MSIIYYMDMPGYITAYKNENGNICLYMYPGLLDNKFIYQYIDEEKLPSFKKIINNDGSILYIFDHKNIKHISACLISNFKSKINDKNVSITL